MAHPDDRIRSIYQRLAAIYDLAARVPVVAQPRRRLFTRAGIRPGQRVLVVGVGTGQDLAHLPAGADVTGIDLSPAMLARARARGTGVVDDPARALAEAARVLAPHGSIWILGKFYETPPGPARRAASHILTTIGGASLTRSLTATIAETPLRVNHHETGSRLADIVQLVPGNGP